MNLIAGFRARVNDLRDKVTYHNIFSSHLIDMRNYYFEKFNKKLLDESVFMSFISKCTGPGQDPLKESLRERRKKFLEKKQGIYKYVPGKGLEVPDFKFANTSGNPIIKSKNFKITKYVLKPELLKNIEEEESVEDEI